MIQNIVQYLNLRLETLGRIADLHGISERRKRESDGANVPYCYVGSGEFKAVNIDNGNVGWWRPRGGFSMEPVEVIGRAVRQQRATYPLRFVAILRRELSTSDDAFMPSRLAEDIANALNFDNGDLRGILKAINVEARASGGEFDAATIWPTEFQTSIPDLRYELAMVAVDVTVEVVGRYSCWEGECATDTDILHLFNFCDPSVVARLTPAQVECLQVIAEDANWELFNTEGTLLSTGSIPSGETDSIVAPDATVLINGNQFDTVASGDAIDIPVVNSGTNPVGSEQSGEWVIGNSTVTINGTQVGDVPATDSLPIAVELDGNPSGTWNAGTQTWEVTSAPCADATFSIDGTQVDTVASGADLDVSVELNGNPVTPTYNSGTKVIGVTSSPCVNATISVTLSDSAPNTGDIIAITATPSGGFVPTNYQFLLFNGSVVLLGSQSGNVLNWTANIIGTYTLYVLATDGTTSAYGSVSVTATGDADATAYLAAVGATDLTRRLAVNTLVSTMKTIGVWSLVDVLYLPIWSNAAVNGLNVKNPLNTDAAFRQVYSGGVTHTTYGSEYNGVNGWGDTFYNPSLISGWADDHHMGLFLNNTPVVGLGWHMGIGNTSTGNPLYAIAIKRIDTVPINGRIYDSGNSSNNGRLTNTIIDSRGFHLGSAIAANDRRLYANGVNILTQTLTVIGTLPNGNINIGRINPVPAGSIFYLQGRMALITMGRGLTVAQAQNYSTAVDVFMTTTNLKLT